MASELHVHSARCTDSDATNRRLSEENDRYLCYLVHLDNPRELASRVGCPLQRIGSARKMHNCPHCCRFAKQLLEMREVMVEMEHTHGINLKELQVGPRGLPLACTSSASRLMHVRCAICRCIRPWYRPHGSRLMHVPNGTKARTRHCATRSVVELQLQHIRGCTFDGMV